MRKDFILFICDFETTGLDPDKDYPIELGGIFTDKDLNGIDIFHKLILLPDDTFELLVKQENGTFVWKEEAMGAYRVHGIAPEELKRSGLPPETCVEKLLEKIDYILSISGKKLKDTAVIITSDNAQFEYRFMKKLFKMASMESKFPFYHSAWDTNLCLQFFAPEIGDAIPVHRSLQDALRIYRQLVRFAEKIDFFIFNKKQ